MTLSTYMFIFKNVGPQFFAKACLYLLLGFLLQIKEALSLSASAHQSYHLVILSLTLKLVLVCFPAVVVGHLLLNKKLARRSKGTWFAAMLVTWPLQLSGIVMYSYWLRHYCPPDRSLRIAAALVLPLILIPFIAQKWIAVSYLTLPLAVFVIVRWIYLAVKQPAPQKATAEPKLLSQKADEAVDGQTIDLKQNIKSELP